MKDFLLLPDAVLKFFCATIIYSHGVGTLLLDSLKWLREAYSHTLILNGTTRMPFFQLRADQDLGVVVFQLIGLLHKS